MNKMGGEIIPIDGKTIRGSATEISKSHSTCHISAWLVNKAQFSAHR